MALSQGLHQKLLLKLSPQQIQVMKLLKLPTAILEERIKEELDDNPALELGEDSKDETELTDEFESEDEEDTPLDGSEEEYEQINISDYIHEGDDDIADYKIRDDNYPEQNDQRTIFQKAETGFNELMLEQIRMLNLSERQHKIAEQIIGNLDDDGYLRRPFISIADDLAFKQNIETTEAEIKELVMQIQQLDPAGVCARNLQECLLLQLTRKADDGQDVAIALKIIEQHFDDFTKKRYEKIQQALILSASQLKEIIHQITKLNPTPGDATAFTYKVDSYIVPDFFVFNNNGNLELTLNSKNAPDLRISEGYREMLKDYERGSKKR